MVPRAISSLWMGCSFLERWIFVDSILYQLFWFVFVFLVMFIIYFFLLRHRIKKQKKQTIGEFNYLVNRFKLDRKKLKYKLLVWGVSLINAFIIAFVSTFIMLIPLSMIWRLLIGFVLLLALIYALYEIYGRFLAKKYKKGD